MVTIGTGRDDPRAWVQAAHLLLGAMQDGQTGPRGKLPAGSEIAAKLGVHPMTVVRAYRELADMGIIYLVPGYGYFPKAGPAVSAGRSLASGCAASARTAPGPARRWPCGSSRPPAMGGQAVTSARPLRPSVFRCSGCPAQVRSARARSCLRLCLTAGGRRRCRHGCRQAA